MSTLPRLRGGIIGCGFFAQFHIDAWRRMPGVELAAACDLDIARAKAFVPSAYTSPEQMLDREALHFVDIVTRPETHLPLVKLAVSQGVHAICQKPMAPTWADCVELAKTADSSNVRVMIHENWRWQPWYREAKRLLLAGAIGEPFSYRFHTRKRDGLGPNPFPDQPYFRTMSRLLIYETIVHHLDTARFLFGEVSSVYAQVRRNNPVLAGEDQAQLLLTHQSELLGMIDGHRMADTTPVGGPVLGEAWIDGEDATLRVDASGDVYVGADLRRLNSVSIGYRGDSVLATQQHFIDCLRSGDRFESDARDYLQTVSLVEAAYESAHLRCAVRPVVG